ncbi:MAG: glycoside hydrolase family 3 N-terminal domain-containing protein [Angustibacter sp.]
MTRSVARLRPPVGLLAVMSIGLTPVSACSDRAAQSADQAPVTAATTTRSPGPAATPAPVRPERPSSTAPLPGRAERALATLDLAERVGQLVMAGTPAAATDLAPDTARTLRRWHVGNVMLTGRSSAGVHRTSRLTDQLEDVIARSSGLVRPLVATDQEGGAVQVLRGAGFSDIPAGTTQAGWSTRTLRERARRWAAELAEAGVTVNLAPVTDVVPTRVGRANPPIGRFGRQLGSDARSVAAHATAFADGMTDRGVLAVAKHFPGLGLASANTDVTADVTDRTTTTGSAAVQAFRDVVAAGIPLVMVSSATYTRIDASGPACFSARVITGLLRREMGFDGVVISDDLGQARQMAEWSPGTRAVRFVRAGGDLVLTVDPATVPPMAGALLAQARRDPDLRRRIDDAALRVLRAKDALGLLGG